MYYWRVNIVIMLICLLLSSCGSKRNNPTVLSPIVSSTDSTSIASPALIKTPTPSPTLMPIISPTLTLFPPLLPTDAENKIIELLRDNGGCRFPCFFGFTPGQTSVLASKSFLNTFKALAPDDFIFDEMGGGVGIMIRRDNLLYSPHIIVEGDRDSQSATIRYIRLDFSAYEERENNYSYVEVFDSPLYAQYFQYYTLPYLLSNNGKPTNVYINFENDMGFHEYYLFLDYTESGWVAMLKMPLTQKDGLLISCPTQAFTRLWLWSPDDVKTANEYGFTASIALKSVSEATALTLDEFYQQYKNPLNTKCLETPADIYTK